MAFGGLVFGGQFQKLLFVQRLQGLNLGATAPNPFQQSDDRQFANWIHNTILANQWACAIIFSAHQT